jgi:hypothetical protein
MAADMPGGEVVDVLPSVARTGGRLVRCLGTLWTHRRSIYRCHRRWEDHIMRSSAPLLDLSAPTITVEEAAEYLGISRGMAYAEASRYRRSHGAD